MIASSDILYQYPASLGEEKNHGKLFVSSSKLMWSDGKHAIPDYIASWSTISSIQTGKTKYCGIRVAEHGSNNYIKFIIGPTNRTNLLILEELRRAIKMVRKHFNSKDPLILSPIQNSSAVNKISSFGIDPVSVIRRYHSYGSIEEKNIDQDLQHPDIYNTARHRNLQERVRGNRISARVAIYGGKKNASTEKNISPDGRSVLDMFKVSPKLEEYIQRSQNLRNEGAQTISSGECSTDNRFTLDSSPPEDRPEGVVQLDIDEVSMPEEEDMTPENDARRDDEDAELSPIIRARKSIEEKKAKREQLLRRRSNELDQPTAPDSPHTKDNHFDQELISPSKDLSDMKRRLEERKLKRMELVKRDVSITEGVKEVGEEEKTKEFVPLQDSNQETSLNAVEVKALVAKQQDRRAALIRRRSGLV